jgi:hypothetical protein
VSGSNRRVIALGNLAGELKTSLEAAARAVGVELLLTREPARAFVELERDGALAVLVDMATLGAEQFCKRARGTERLRSVPVIGMSRHPNELGFARVFAWGADDLVPLGGRVPLERRLEVLRDTPPPDTTGFGQAVVAEATTQRRALVGRVLAQAGYDVKFAVDRGAVELYASQSETRLVVISAALGDPRRMIEASAKAGALPTWIVTVEARSTQRLAASLTGLDRVAVTSTAGSPEDVLFLANELVFSKGARRREWRALYATPVAFRPQGGDSDEYGFSYDASPRGLYVRSLLPCSTGEVEVELRLPNRDDRVRLTGTVAKRFAFGSGAIASAPPGFGVRLEGPEDALAQWTDACAELIAAASSESLPPRPRSPSQPVLQSPGLGGKEVTLAVPPATISIESVVAPLPISMKSAAAEGSDVGELLAATLDEQTLTEVGTRPVTMDPTGGVREERPSEYAVSLQGLDPLATPIINEPLKAVLAVPVPTPAPAVVVGTAAEPPPPSSRSAAVPRPEPRRALSGTLVLDAEAPPPSPRAADWDSDAKTTIRDSQPILDAERAAKAELPAPSAESDVAEPDPPGAELAELPADPLEHAEAAERAIFTDASEPGRAFAATVVAAQAAPLPIPAEAPRAPPPPPPRTAPHKPSIKQTLPMGFQKQEVPKAEPQVPKAEPQVPKAEPQVPKAEPQVPKQMPRSPSPARAEAKPALNVQRILLYTVASLAALGVGVGAAFVVHRQQAPGAAPAVEQRAALAPRPPAATTATATAALPTTTAAPATPSSIPSAASVPTSAAITSASAPAPAASEPAAPVPSTPPATTAAAAPPVSGPAIELNKLPPDRAALIVHSSASTHVFVHGTDYGETNRPLITSCGIRFVRLGRALGDFIEPGQPHVIKCGRLTELTIEPSH